MSRPEAERKTPATSLMSCRPAARGQAGRRKAHPGGAAEKRSLLLSLSSPVNPVLWKTKAAYSLSRCPDTARHAQEAGPEFLLWWQVLGRSGMRPWCSASCTSALLAAEVSDWAPWPGRTLPTPACHAGHAGLYTVIGIWQWEKEQRDQVKAAAVSCRLHRPPPSTPP